MLLVRVNDVLGLGFRASMMGLLGLVGSLLSLRLMARFSDQCTCVCRLSAPFDLS